MMMMMATTVKMTVGMTTTRMMIMNYAHVSPWQVSYGTCLAFTEINVYAIWSGFVLSRLYFLFLMLWSDVFSDSLQGPFSISVSDLNQNCLRQQQSIIVFSWDNLVFCRCLSNTILSFRQLLSQRTPWLGVVLARSETIGQVSPRSQRWRSTKLENRILTLV